jgi:peptidoglycan hydrolase CwlO-like protein
MSTKEILVELKAHVKDLTSEKDRLHEDLKNKDSRIKLLLQKIEQADDDVKAMGKKLSENNRKMMDMEIELRELKETLESSQTKKPDEESTEEITEEQKTEE